MKSFKKSELLYINYQIRIKIWRNL